jgi:hypothetical protein
VEFTANELQNSPQEFVRTIADEIGIVGDVKSLGRIRRSLVAAARLADCWLAAQRRSTA